MMGCIGKITSFIETPDYRIVLNLEGICRFTINEYNLSQNGYYVGDIDISNFEEDLNEIEPQIDRDNLLKIFKLFKIKSRDRERFFKKHPIYNWFLH